MGSPESRPLGERIAAAKRTIRETSVDGVQRRSFAMDAIDTRDAGDGAYTITGHGAVFNSMSENLGGFREIIAPGAFAEVIAGRPDVRALYNHDPNLVLAWTTNSTLRLSEDATGLAYRADVARTSYAADLRVLLERGDVSQSSFAFRVARGGDTWEEDEETGALIRTITKFSALYDVSPVTYPAYPAADSGLASTRMDAGDIGTIAQMLVLAADFLDDADEEGDAEDIALMQGVIKTLTCLLSAEELEAAAFARIAERIGGGPSAGERADDGGTTDTQADDAPWRLRADQRRMALRDRA